MNNLHTTSATNRPKWIRYCVAVLGIHLVGIFLLFPVAREYPQFLGIAFLAYTLGLRHAFDADHIAAIDNTVRKMMQQNQESTGVGFFFSLGHSSVVFVMALITALSMDWAKNNIPQLQAVGGLIGTAVSGVFLLLIGLFNLYIWFDIYRLFMKMHNVYTGWAFHISLGNLIPVMEGVKVGECLNPAHLLFCVELSGRTIFLCVIIAVTEYFGMSDSFLRGKS